MLIKRMSGMTLIELVVAIVIISIGLAGVLVSFSTAVKSSADPIIHKQMISIASEMMNEITLKPYTIAANTASAACARNTYNDIVDYDGYSATGICDVDGTAIPDLASYSISTTVKDSTLNGLAAKLITVTVSHGAENIQLLSWRVDWAS